MLQLGNACMHKAQKEKLKTKVLIETCKPVCTEGIATGKNRIAIKNFKLIYIHMYYSTK